MKIVCKLSLLLAFCFNLNAQDAVNWMSWEDAIAANEKNPKKVYIDLYTDWCGWCKKMDASTFTDPEVVKYMNENFHSVKFNAEQKEDIEFNGTTFSFVESGRRGVHQLAYSLLNGRLGYPSFVILDEELARILISPGFKDAAGVMLELVFANEEKYKTIGWDSYKAQATIANSPKVQAAQANQRPQEDGKPKVDQDASVKPTATPRPTTKPSTPRPQPDGKPKVDQSSTEKLTTRPQPDGKPKVDQTVEAKPVVKPRPDGQAVQRPSSNQQVPPSNSNEQVEIFKVVEQMPRFSGCEKMAGGDQVKAECARKLMFTYIMENLKYPEAARKNNVEGTAVVQFVIDKTGKVTNPILLRDLPDGCGQAALDMVKDMPNWIPGHQRGQKVNVQYTLPVRFKL